MSKLKRAIFTLYALVMVGATLAPAGAAFAARAGSDRCPTGRTVYGRAECIGYFTGADVYGSSGIDVDDVIENGTVSLENVDNTDEFVSLMKSLLNGSKGANDQMGAAFIIDLMLGKNGSAFGTVAKGVAYAKTNIAEWESRVRYYESKGWVKYQKTVAFAAGFQNSARSKIIKNDDIFYIKTTAETKKTIVFTNPDNTHFEIKQDCGNVVGTPKALVDVPDPKYSLYPGVNMEINDGNTEGTVAQLNDKVTFTYTVRNGGETSDGTSTCNIYGNTYNGYNIPDDPETSGTGVGYGGCTGRTFTKGATATIFTETFTVSAAQVGKTICRSLVVNPATPAGPPRADGACVVIAQKPYVKVFGGDVATGGGMENAACTPNATASINSWNKEDASYTGAGTQFAVMALGNIDQFATSQAATGVNKPSGLAFSNTVLNDTYGGSFGSLPCIPDYYGQAANTTAVAGTVNVSSLVTGAYKSSGNITISGGNANPGNRIVLYVDGDAYISSNITYPGTWTYDKVPLFELVVSGNIYIAPGVTQLDGAYIAQQKNGAKGGIYTCATAAGPYALTDGAFYTPCKNKLTINGLFSATQVYLMRTFGTISSATANETAASSNAGEVFNYNPTLWIAQPPTGSNTNNSKVGKYDAITSLPPVL